MSHVRLLIASYRYIFRDQTVTNGENWSPPLAQGEFLGTGQHWFMAREDFGGLEMFVQGYRRHPNAMVRRFALIGAWSGMAFFVLPIALLVVYALLTPETFNRLLAAALALALTWWCLRYIKALLRVSS